MRGLLMERVCDSFFMLSIGCGLFSTVSYLCFSYHPLYRAQLVMLFYSLDLWSLRWRLLPTQTRDFWNCLYRLEMINVPSNFMKRKMLFHFQWWECPISEIIKHLKCSTLNLDLKYYELQEKLPTKTVLKARQKS